MTLAHLSLLRHHLLLHLRLPGIVNNDLIPNDGKVSEANLPKFDYR
jgi:hypothetical protein